jgi:exonuclease III
MTAVVKLATPNINGITTRKSVGMLVNYIRRHELDILFMQEITSTELVNMRGYEAHYNFGTQLRGTTIVARSEFHLTNITTLPTGRAIAADYKGIRLINIYAPPERQGRQKGSNFTTPNCPSCYTPTMET